MTLEELDRRLQESAESVRRSDHLRRLCAATRTQIDEVRQAVAEHETRVDKEERDVTRLEEGFAGFLAGLVGSREKRLTRERAEALAARQLLDGERLRLAALLEDQAGLERELGELRHAYEEYPRLLADKEQLLLRLGDPRAARLSELAAQLTEAGALIREHDEAHQAALAAQQALGRVLEHLGSARGHSTWDMLGGGMMADAFEHDRLKQAEQAAWQAQRTLDVLARELADLGIRANPQLPKVDTRWFVDAFFDNIITDAIKHDRITRTHRGVEEVAGWTERMLRAVVNGRAVVAQRRLGLLSEREHLLTAKADHGPETVETPEAAERARLSSARPSLG